MIALSENLLSISEAARILPGRPHVATLWRWASARGIRGVRLETLRVGGRTYTSHEALARFAARLSDSPVSEAPTPTAQRRAREIERAEAELDAAGI